MLKLAELFCLHNLQVTFLNSHHIQSRLQSFSDVDSLFKNRYPTFRFLTLPDGLPEDNPRTGDQIGNLIESIKAVTQPLFKELLSSGFLGSGSENPVSCLLADGVFGFAADIAKEISVPLVYFDTISPCGLLSYLCLPKLIQSGEFPFKDNDLNCPVNGVREMECIIRRRDLPHFYSFSDPEDPLIQLILEEDRQIPKAHGLIFNTFEDLDRGTLAQMRTLGPKVYAIGPLHAHVKTSLESYRPVSSYSLWKEDTSCIYWLDQQPTKSVIYVSIGSLAVMSKDQLMEIWFGLVNSGSRFLWVRRPGSIIGFEEENEIPELLVSKTKEMGCIVSWAPQELVLSHRAIGGFLTHSGWNSTLESIAEGVPMICWPCFVDQQVNSRYVEQVWKLGLDMKDMCDRVTLEKMVKDLMGLRRDEFLSRADEMAKLAKKSIREGGSSHTDLLYLIEDIKLKKFGQ